MKPKPKPEPEQAEEIDLTPEEDAALDAAIDALAKSEPELFKPGKKP